MLREGHLGIHPPGALGVSFFVHAKADCIIGRSGDGITDVLKEAGALNLSRDSRLRSMPVHGRVLSNLLEADALDRIPELLFVCCNPDQLEMFTAEMTRYLENLAGRGRLQSLEDIRSRVPILLVLPNGILSEQMIRTFEEQLHESLLMDRLPGVNSLMADLLIDRVVRGVSLQAGGRIGSGADTVYILEKKGSVVFAGGGELERRRIEEILRAHEYGFEHKPGVPRSRIEFDKAMISIVLNVGGLIHMVEPDGSLTDLRMGDLCKDSSKAEFVEKITRAVFAVGRAVGAYPEELRYEVIWSELRDGILKHAGHITSSVKSLRDTLGSGLCAVKLFPNEEWILTPLRQTAANAGLAAEESLMRVLQRQVQESMARAIRYRDRDSVSGHSESRAMRLTAQRNFGLEMYEDGDDTILLVGTMLDAEHLITLEMSVYLPDEQITRCKMKMVRSPFPVCSEVEPIAERLVGLRIQSGVLGEVSRRVGSSCGCIHIKELATNIIYFAAANLIRRRSGVDSPGSDYANKPPEERFSLTKDLLRDSCLAYCQTTPCGLDEHIGIHRVGEEHAQSMPLGSYEPSVGALLTDRAARFGDKVYLRYREGGRPVSISWKEFETTVRNIARHLVEMGISRGDHVVMLSENRPEMFMFELACMAVGAVTIPVFAGYQSSKIEYVMEHARPRMVVVSGNHQLEKIERHKHPWVNSYYCMDFDSSSRKWGAVDFATLTADGGVADSVLDTVFSKVGPDDPCMVMYTSGTTGMPKGVRLCHRNLISQQKALSLIWDVTEKDVFLSYLPWHHSFGGLFERFMTLYMGCELCLDDSHGRDIDRMIENWKAFRPTIFLSVPRIHDLLVTRCKEDSETADFILGDRLRFCFTAGASLPSHVEEAYREHSIPVLEGWGLTETSPCVTQATLGTSWRSGYVGFPIPGVSIRIGADQEIHVKGPNVMDGYLNDEESTALVIDGDGWFRTGDLGEFTKDGLRIFGRKDGAFKLTTGEKVHPQRIENLLMNESPYVRNALALGDGRDFVAALIYPDLHAIAHQLNERGENIELSEDGLERLAERSDVREMVVADVCRVNSLSDIKYQRVRRIIIADHDPSLANGELTPSGKIVRKAVVARYTETIEQLFAAEPASDVLEVFEQQPRRMRAHEA